MKHAKRSTTRANIARIEEEIKAVDAESRHATETIDVTPFPSQPFISDILSPPLSSPNEEPGELQCFEALFEMKEASSMTSVCMLNVTRWCCLTMCV